MKLVDNIKDSSYMVLSDLAFVFSTNNIIKVYNLKNIKQITEFRIISKESILIVQSNMSETNKYKSMAIIERNKSDLIDGFKEWVNIQKNE